MEKNTFMDSAPMKLTRYLVRMDPPLSQDTARKIIFSLKGVPELERDRRAEKALEVLQRNLSEEEILEALDL